MKNHFSIEKKKNRFLDHNSLSGSIPSSIENLKNLKKL